MRIETAFKHLGYSKAFTKNKFSRRWSRRGERHKSDSYVKVLCALHEQDLESEKRELMDLMEIEFGYYDYEFHDDWQDKDRDQEMRERLWEEEQERIEAREYERDFGRDDWW